MKILHCDCCHVEVNDFGHWYNDDSPRSMYELNCIHEFGEETLNGYILCEKCIKRLLDTEKHISEKE